MNFEKITQSLDVIRATISEHSDDLRHNMSERDLVKISTTTNQLIHLREATDKLKEAVNHLDAAKDIKDL